MIDPAIWDSEQVMSLTPAQFKIYIFLISQADDKGRLKVSMQLWRTRIFPFNPPIDKEFTADIQHLLEINLVKSYEHEGEMYIYHPNWARYQMINRPTPSKLPSPPDLNEDSVNAREGLTSNRREVNRKEEKDILSGKPDDLPDFDVNCKAIILLLNTLAGTHFRQNAKGTRDLIRTRMKEKATLQDFEKVIKIKVEQWADDEKMKGYLRPETLFARNHFESYRNEWDMKHGDGADD